MYYLLENMSGNLKTHKKNPFINGYLKFWNWMAIINIGGCMRPILHPIYITNIKNKVLLESMNSLKTII